MNRSELPIARHHIRESGAVLAIRIIFAILIAELLYSVIYLIFSNALSLSTIDYQIFLVVGLSLTKITLECLFIIIIILQTASNNYYITDAQLIVHRGIFAHQEKVYGLQHIRSVERHGTWLGRLLGYGNLHISFAQSSFREDVHLNNIIKVKRYEQALGESMKKFAVRDVINNP